jgi:P-type Cu+ transporter
MKYSGEKQRFSMYGEPKTDSQKTVVSLPVEGMTCASCVLRVEKTLKKIEGVSQASVNLATNRAMIELDPALASLETLRDAVQNAGYTMHLPSEYGSGGAAQTAGDGMEERTARSLKKDFVVSAILTVPVMILSMTSMTEWFHTYSPLTMDEVNGILFVLTTALMFGPGKRFFIGLWKSIRHLSADMNTLVAVGTGAAYAFSASAVIFPQRLGASVSGATYFDTAATIITLILLGKLLESRAKHRASEAIRLLAGLQPKTALVNRFGEEMNIPVEQVLVGDTVIIKPGERIPVDGIVLKGESAIDESMMTGESLPVRKGIHDSITGGTMNKNGSIEFRATAVGKDTVLAHIISLVETAQGSKAPVQLLADKIASVFVPIVIGIALVTFLVWLLTGAPFATALIHSIAVLIIACPCALGLATPTAIIVGVGVGAEHGILIRNAGSLERVHKTTDVVFDKTGTLTEGAPGVTDMETNAGMDERMLLSLVASVERLSEHPLASAILDEAKKRGIEPGSAEEFMNFPGSGISATVDGHAVAAGNEGMMSQAAVDVSDARPLAERHAREGKTVVFVAVDGRYAGLIAIADPLRASSRAAVTALRKMHRTVTLLTGDTMATAESIARQAGIDHVIAKVLPQDKVAFVSGLQSQGRFVAMAGDGINDAPALAQADVSIAMGSGSDVAMETADITLMSSDLMHVADAIRLSEKTLSKIRQNLFWAFVYNIVGIPLAALGFLNPMIAAAAMAFSSVSVVSNSLLLKRMKFRN